MHQVLFIRMLIHESKISIHVKDSNLIPIPNRIYTDGLPKSKISMHDKSLNCTITDTPLLQRVELNVRHQERNMEGKLMRDESIFTHCIRT